MLKHLYIKNYALIDELDIDFQNGFSVITGETGAGKSIVLGAIGLLLGNRADIKAIKPGEKKCIVEAQFDITNYGLEKIFNDYDAEYDASECIVRRELMASGKSRAFVNDSPVSLQFLKALGNHLVDIHSQHQNLLLQDDDFQLEVVDIVAGDDKELKSYVGKYNVYHDAQNKLAKLKNDIEKARQNEDFIRFQYEELQNARLSDGIQEELENESSTLSHSEEIKAALFKADNILNADADGIVGRADMAADALHSIENVYPKVAELAKRLDSAKIELDDIAAEISTDSDEVDFNPQRLDEVNEQLDTIYSLEKKHHVNTVAELLAIKDDFEKQLQSIDDSSEETEKLEQAVAEAKADCEKAAKVLSAKRNKAAQMVEKEMLRRLVTLGMPNVRFKVEMQKTDLSAKGVDSAVFLFSANKSTDLMPVAEVASGGEIARVMLSLKAMISGAVNRPTIIFDEIDTGVSGAIAAKMAQLMKEMAQAGRQVISITHLPQIAAAGNAHYKVEKRETAEGTKSHMRRLSEEERVKEIAAMLSGDNITDAALQNARELLNRQV